MIIGISGYAGSGKDLVARLIQFNNFKDQAYEVVPTGLNDVVDNRVGSYVLESGSGWHVKKFSGVLKKMASMLTGIPEYKFEDQEFKNTFLGREWAIPEDNMSSIIFDDIQFMKLMTVREFLQKLGTDAIRDGLHPNAWVNATMAQYKRSHTGYDSEGGMVYEYPNWIITDCRFPNEAKAIKNKGGYIIRVERAGVRPINAHPSETALDNWDFDYKIFNGSDVISLNQSVRIVMDMIKKNEAWQTN